MEHGLVHARCAEQFRPPALQKTQVVRVVDDAHLVGFGISNTNAGFAQRHFRTVVHWLQSTVSRAREQSHA